MLAIKLRPIGKKKQISYRIVINEKRSKLDGKCIEDIGWYNPHTNKFLIKKDRIEHWLKAGAQPTDSVHNILVKAKAIEGAKIAVHKKSKHPEAQETDVQKQKGEPSEPVVAETSESKPEEKVETPEAEVVSETPTE